MVLQYLKHKEIDFKKWDNALQNCSNKLIYAQSNYLNCLCSNWDAIISSDYTILMPIPIKTKLGIKYSPVVPFIQQLGIFSTQNITNDVILQFINLCKQNIRLIEYNFNYSNEFSHFHLCNNYILNLQNDYSLIEVKYKNNLRRILKKTNPQTKIIEYDYAKAIDFFNNEYKTILPNISSIDYDNFKKLCKNYLQNNNLICYAIELRNEIIATSIFLKDENRIYNILPASNKIGKLENATHFITDYLIKQYSNTNYIFDFEGSDIEGIANFYQQFGAINQPYYSWNYKNLPRFIIWAKKLKSKL